MSTGHYKAVGQLKPLFSCSLVTSSIYKHSDNVFWFDVMPRGEEKFVSVYIIIGEKIGLIETVPASSNVKLQNGIEEAGIDLKDRE